MSAHHNFDHADATYIPQAGNGRTLCVAFTGRDWIGYHDPLPGGGYAHIHHMPSKQGLPTDELKAAGWVLDFGA